MMNIHYLGYPQQANAVCRVAQPSLISVVADKDSSFSNLLAAIRSWNLTVRQSTEASQCGLCALKLDKWQHTVLVLSR